MGYGLSRESTETKVAMRTVILTSADTDFRTRLKQQLTAMRWSVREAGGGAEAMAQLEAEGAEAMVLDTELPDLEVGEFANEMRQLHPVMDLLRVDAGADDTGPRSPRRNELLHALRQAQRDSYLGGVGDRSARSSAPVAPPSLSAGDRLAPRGERAIAALDVAEILRSRSQAAPTDSRRPVPTEPETSGASQQPLQQRSMEGAFRLDLYHRLAVFPVRVPPLRDRMEDVLLLAEFLLAKLGEDSPAKRLSAGAAMKLLEHDWPGNVRELAHVLERGVIFAEDRREISREDIRF
jgi:DNA-binding NtrC family response regulator